MNFIVPTLNLTTGLAATFTNESSLPPTSSATSLFNDYNINDNNNNHTFLEQNYINATTNVNIFDNYIHNNNNNNNISNHENAINDLITNITTILYDFGKQLLTTINAENKTNNNNDTNILIPTTPIPPPSSAKAKQFNNMSKGFEQSVNLFNNNNTFMLNEWFLNSENINSTLQMNNDNKTQEGQNYAESPKVVNTNANVDSMIPDTKSIYNNFDIYDDYEEFDPCHPNNTNFNCSQSDFVKFVLGPQTLPLYKALLFTIIFGGIFITSMVGNILVCIVIIRHPTMHTATNYYLFSLAVSDLIYLLFGLPAEIFLYWHQYPYLFGQPFCKIRAFISEASTYVSVLTIVAFSMERFLAICHPLHLYAMSGFKRALRIIAGLWIASLLSAIPFGLLTDIIYLEYPLTDKRIPESAFCSMIHYPAKFPLFEVSFCVFFIVPMVIIFILYSKMGVQIRFSTTLQLGVQRCSMHRVSRHQQSRKAVIRMLAAVVITFFICWLPFHMQRLWFLYAKEHNSFAEINEWMFSIAGFTYYVSCTINPILYNVMSHRYRVAFKDILLGKRPSVYYNNGFARDQSSFRETTIGSTGGGAHIYDRVNSVRVRSMHRINNNRDRSSIKFQTPLWTEKPDYNMPIRNDTPESTLKYGTNVVVVMDNGAKNGRPKVFTENDVETSLINKSNETSI